MESQKGLHCQRQPKNKLTLSTESKSNLEVHFLI